MCIFGLNSPANLYYGQNNSTVFQYTVHIEQSDEASKRMRIGTQCAASIKRLCFLYTINDHQYTRTYATVEYTVHIDAVYAAFCRSVAILGEPL